MHSLTIRLKTFKYKWFLSESQKAIICEHKYFRF